MLRCLILFINKAAALLSQQDRRIWILLLYKRSAVLQRGVGQEKIEEVDPMKMKQNWLYVSLVTLLLTLPPAPVYGGGSSEEETQTLAPYFFVEGADPAVDHFPLKDTTVESHINGAIAETYVTQTYSNEGSRPINASYVFPVSTKVSVHGMTMTIDDQVISAQIQEKEEAKETFETAKSEGKSASLLEEQRPNVFTMDVANIMPGDEVRIKLHYTELIGSTDGTYQFVFPTVTGPRYPSPSEADDPQAEKWVASPYLPQGSTVPGTYAVTVDISAGVPISQITSPSHQIKVSQEEATLAQVTLADPSVYAGDRDLILEYTLAGETLAGGLQLDKGDDESFFMLTLQPPERVLPQDILPREYIFVLDVSGSMGGYPLDTAKSLIRDLVSGLTAQDSFNLILFSDDTIPLADRSLPADRSNINLALDLIDRLEGGGGTMLAPALLKALSLPQDGETARSIVIITDGYLSGEKEIFDLVRKNLGDTSFFSFGIGTSVNRYLIEGIGTVGAGEAFVVTDEEEAPEAAARFRTYIQAPLLTDIQVDFDGFEAYDVEPSAIPTLFAKKPVVLFGKWRGEPSGTIHVSGKTAKGDYQLDIPVSQAAEKPADPAIRYLWARTRVAQLTDLGSPKGDEDAVRKEVTDLGLRYSMMTPYTSFVAVSETVRNPQGESTDVDQPLPLPSRVSDLAVGAIGYTTGSEPGGICLILMALLLPAVWHLRKKATGYPKADRV